MKTPACLLLTVLLILPYGIHGQKKEDKQLSYRVVALSPEEQRNGFRLAPGFVIELVASEKDGIIKPVDLAFDDAGNLWTQTARMYPLDPISDIQWNDLLELMNDREKQNQHPAFQRVAGLYKGDIRGEDQILKISGLYGGTPQVSVWADGLAIPMSVLPYKSGALVAQGSEIFLLDDTNRDGKADRRIPLFTGFGFTDSHTMAHLLRKGPGGWIHFSHGALNRGQVTSYTDPSVKTSFDYSKIGKFTPDGRNLEVLVAGLNNIWGYTLRGDGQWYGSEANDLGYSIVPLDEGSAFPGIGNEKFRPYQPFYPPIHEFRVGGTGLSGLAFSDDETGGFPEPWRNVGFLANPITNSINSVRIIRKPDGSIESEKLEDLLVSADDWFRPVNIIFGPDGCLYIADWYNKIVSHNEVPTSHPDRDKKHGRIWRIRHESQPVRKIVNFYEVPAQQLPGYLKSPYLWEKRAAWNQISERPRNETAVLIPQLIQLALDQQQSTSTRVHALWSLESLDFYEEEFTIKALIDKDDQIRRETLRYLAGRPENISHYLQYLDELSRDANAGVRSQLILTLGKIPQPSPGVIRLLVGFCQPDVKETQVGGPYERKFERYLARRVLETFPEQLESYLTTQSTASIPRENALWAMQILPPGHRADLYFKYASSIQGTEIGEETFLELAGMAENERARNILTACLADPGKRITYVNYALKHQSVINTKAFSSLLAEPVSALLRTGEPNDQRKALETIVNFNLALPGEEIAEVTKATRNEGTLNLALNALNITDKSKSQHYLDIANDRSLSLSTRLNALQGVIRLDRKTGRATAETWLRKMDPIEKRSFTNVLSRYTASSKFLLELWEKKKLAAGDFEIMTAERIHSLTSDKTKSVRLVEEIRRNQEAHQKRVAARIESLKEVTENARGDAVNGRVLFQTCLMCHQVNGQGQNLAPALDGLGYRDADGLLHAILDPDAAIESGYALFRVVKKDDSILEGYLLKRDSGGTTLAFMGGSQIFIPASDIKSQHTVTGKSFMPTGLFDNLSEKEVADILTYIRSLK